MSEVSTDLTQYFDGGTFDAEKDAKRLTRQLDKVRGLMMDGRWRTLKDIELATKFPTTSISARLRDLRKPRFGSFIVESKRVKKGLYAYRVLPPIEEPPNKAESMKVDSSVEGTSLRQQQQV